MCIDLLFYVFGSVSSVNTLDGFKTCCIGSRVALGGSKEARVCEVFEH